MRILDVESLLKRTLHPVTLDSAFREGLKTGLIKKIPVLLNNTTTETGMLPGEIHVADEIQPEKTEELAREYLNNRPEILNGAHKYGQDLVAFSSSHGTEILVGVGIATLASIVSGIVLFSAHSENKKSIAK